MKLKNMYEFNIVVDKNITLGLKHKSDKRGGQAGKKDLPNQDSMKILENLNNNNENLAQINLFVICDGHGVDGHLVSEYVSKNLFEKLSNKNLSFPLTENTTRIIYREIANKLQKKEYSQKSGTTAVVLIIYKTGPKNSKKLSIQTINVGDSRAIIVTNRFATALTLDHKIDKPNEKKRINCGNYRELYENIAIYNSQCDDIRIKKILAPSRVFGDLELAPYITHVPEIFIRELSEMDNFIVISSDGLWDSVDNQTVADYLYELDGYTQSQEKLGDLWTYYTNCDNEKLNEIKTLDNWAKSLTELALYNNSDDDISIIIVKLQNIS